LIACLPKEDNDPNANLSFSVKYLNRLSDYLFMTARFIAFKEGHEDVIYKK
jgi:cob(I)alamin adenosyltransferase